MKIKSVYSHQNGLEWLKCHRPQLWREITKVIKGIDAQKHRTKVSEEKTMMGRSLYSPVDLNKTFNRRLTPLGWNSRRVDYFVCEDAETTRRTLLLEPEDQKKCIEAAGFTAIHSYHQTDHVKHEVAIEVQFGKYSFAPLDLFVKHMGFYISGSISVGIEVLAMKSMQAEMSSGPGYFEGTLHYIVRQGRGAPAVPLILIGIAP